RHSSRISTGSSECSPKPRPTAWVTRSRAMDRPRNSALSRFLVSGMLVVLGACGGGADTVQNPAGPGGATATYTGPPPATADVQAFKINVWESLRTSNRCGQCHVAGGQTPQFVRQDDV